jgi:hypothetical protein
MKLVEMFEEGKNRVFTSTDRDGIPISFVVKYYGRDGGGLSIWHGKMKAGTEDPVPVTMVVHDDASIVAVNTAEPLKAAKHIINTKRKAYGPSIVPERSFNVRRYNGMKLEGYQ